MGWKAATASPGEVAPDCIYEQLTRYRECVHCGCTHVGAIVKHVGIKQARQELPDLIDRAEAGEEIVITRQGKPVAKLIPAPKPVKALPSLTEFRQGIGRAGTSAAQLLREERDGR